MLVDAMEGCEGWGHTYSAAADDTSTTFTSRLTLPLAVGEPERRRQVLCQITYFWAILGSAVGAKIFYVV